MDLQLSDQVRPLFDAQLLKVVDVGDDSMKFSGIASDESRDEEGDVILKKALDLTYAQKRGYVNWNHEQSPASQIGILTKTEVITPRQLDELRKTFPGLSDTASVYVEGVLHKHVPMAVDVQKIMKSNGERALGLSLEGSLMKSQGKGVVKAFVRGVAVTPQPAHTSTLVRLMKSISTFNDQTTEVETELQKGLNRAEAILWVLENRPKWSLDMAKATVDIAIGNMKG